uniref:WW domain binding protein VOPP1 n=1 Tax=Sinocyclocheilus rhinocerous TaxID=307959 RepID=A0A673JSE6_9TELE
YCSCCGKTIFLLVLVFSVSAVQCICFHSSSPLLHSSLFICRSYEDCCGTRCCVRALSIQRLWYFWLLLMMGVFFCCGAGFFIRRRMYPSVLSEEPAFNVSFTRQPVSSPGQLSQQPGMQGYGDPCGAMTTALTPGQTTPAHMMSSYPPPPSYCNHPPPSYEQVFRNAEKKSHSESSQ